MWPDADTLNAQTLDALGVEEGGLIHCAVRPLIHCTQPNLSLRSTARQFSEAAAHTPPTQAGKSPLSLAGAPAAR